MRSKKITQVFIILAVVLLAVTSIFASCEEGFTHPELPTGSGVTSNGGLAVTYGDYLYYVNGAQSSNTSKNNYTGEVKTGDIVRIKLSDIPELFDFYSENHEDSEYSADLADLVFEKVEVVVPMFYYSGNTTNKSINGLWIFDSKLYFITPNIDLNANGKVKNDQLDIYSCTLDGKNLTRLYTFSATSATSTQAAIWKSGSDIWTVYIDGAGQLCTANLSANKTETVIAKSASSPSFNVETQRVFYIDNAEYLDDDNTEKNENYKNIMYYTLGDTEAKVLVKNPDSKNESYTISQTNTVDNVGYVYYTITNTTDPVLDTQGVWMISTTATAPVRLIVSTTNFDSFLCYKDKIVVAGKRAVTNPETIQLYVISNNGGTLQYDYILPINTNSNAITLESIVGSTLTYTLDSKTYTVNLNQTISGTAGLSNIEEIYSTISPSDWFGVDTISHGGQTYFLAFSSSNINIYQYVANEDGDMELQTVLIKAVQPVED